MAAKACHVHLLSKMTRHEHFRHRKMFANMQREHSYYRAQTASSAGCSHHQMHRPLDVAWWSQGATSWLLRIIQKAYLQILGYPLAQAVPNEHAVLCIGVVVYHKGVLLALPCDVSLRVCHSHAPACIGIPGSRSGVYSFSRVNLMLPTTLYCQNTRDMQRQSMHLRSRTFLLGAMQSRSKS